MSFTLPTCPKCKSRNIETLNPELIKTVQEYIVELKAKCKSCGHEFEYSSPTDYGYYWGVLY